jgi:hypothetical protein
MRTLMRALLALSMSLALALYGAALAAPAPASGPLTELVICSDGGPETILLDAAGNPAKPARKCCKCQSCLAAVDAFVPQHPFALTAPDLAVRQVRPGAGRTVCPDRALYPMPRGPPTFPETMVNLNIGGAGSLFASLEFGQVSRGWIVRPLGHFSEVAR